MEKLIDIVFNVISAFIVKVVGLVMIISVLLQIASRYLPFTLLWTDEVARLTFIWFCMLATAIAYEKSNHLCLDYFVLKLSKRVQNILEYAAQIIVFVFSVVITVKGIELIGVVAVQRSPVLNLSMSVFYSAIPFGFGLIAIFDLLSFIQKITRRSDTRGEAKAE